MTDFNQKTHDTDVGSHGGQSRQMMEVFENQEFGSIRVLQEAGKTFFCASDVAKALGYVNPYAAVKRHCRGLLKGCPSKGCRSESGISVRFSLAAASAAEPLRFSVVILVFAFAIQLLNLLPAVIDVILTCEKRLFCLALHRSSTSLTTCCFSFPMLFLRSSPLIRTGVHISRILL